MPERMNGGRVGGPQALSERLITRVEGPRALSERLITGVEAPRESPVRGLALSRRRTRVPWIFLVYHAAREPAAGLTAGAGPPSDVAAAINA